MALPLRCGVRAKSIVLTGAEHSVPLHAQSIRGVTLIGIGTMEGDVRIITWPVPVGFGLRIHINFFGPVPIVKDFGFPVAKDDQHDTRVFNFSFGASF